MFCSLTVKRWKCGLVGIGGCLYAVGGMDSPKAGHWGLPLKTVERYDPDLDVWTEVASMNEARFGCAVAAYQVSTYSRLLNKQHYRGSSPYANFISANFIIAIFQNFPVIFGLCDFCLILFH